MKYIGFSSKNFLSNRSFTLTDKELIKEDLMNRIFTSRIKGERIMMENYGTTIPDAVFEPLDEELISTIVEDLEFVFNRDPRIKLHRLQPVPNYDTQTLTVFCEFSYVELSGTDQLEIYLEFNE